MSCASIRAHILDQAETIESRNLRIATLRTALADLKDATAHHFRGKTFTTDDPLAVAWREAERVLEGGEG
jgi:hypothetical protein